MTGKRLALLAAGVGLLILGIGPSCFGNANPLTPLCIVPGVMCLVAGCVNVASPSYKRYLAAPPDGSWQATGERFIDTASGKVIAVYSQPATAERVYVAE